jgi:hypothetical protein
MSNVLPWFKYLKLDSVSMKFKNVPADLGGGRIAVYDVGDAYKFDQCTRILRMRMMGLPWADIAHYEGQSKSTIMDMYRSYMGDFVLKYKFTKEGLGNEQHLWSSGRKNTGDIDEDYEPDP